MEIDKAKLIYRKAVDQRREKMKRMQRAGLSLRQIGKHYGLSGERVRQVIAGTR